MAKKKTGKVVSKSAAKAVKKAKAAQKVERKEKKKSTKSKDEEGTTKTLRASLTSDDGKAYFYGDVFRYSPEKDEWRKFVSPTCPGPRSAHAVVASPAGGGKLYLFGGEFSSLYQNSFHHYRDFWCFDISTHTWERIETKVRPTARSGHRMAMWKHYIVLFGGFYDPGLKTNYLNDLWLFDTQEYKWKQVEFKDNDRKPSPRSGFSFLPTPEGILLHGGYCKEYVKGSRPVGVMLDDTWFLRHVLVTNSVLCLGHN
ncbi:Kelch repeat-containing protein 3 [Grifola frondosa]|uniref:Kelch repeat-containing protein 3 n=1 Tax=Grifola frondosa TaxID=5627 RepID=A0A1C7LLG4_GRIFR|nr:Kelch repeat-containing protein 3 [Grifola frondosa]